MKNTAMATKALVLLVSVLMLSTTLYAGQPVRSTPPGQNQISEDGAVWGFCRTCGSTKDANTSTVSTPVRTAQPTPAQASINRDRVSQYLRSLLNSLGGSQEGAVWGFCGRSCIGS